ncbi:MAG: tetratricopeptide repeat protein [Candidatus Omnitrophica bacterium]|nr:tetratricopeptide repeat protein [Candidatus Omnitrophota bacterium]
MKLKPALKIAAIAFIAVFMTGKTFLFADYAADEKILREAVAKNPKDYEAATQLGSLYWDVGKRRAAIGLFRKAMKTAPDYPPPYFFLGQAYILERKPEKGFAQFNFFEKKMEALPGIDENAADFYSMALHAISRAYFRMKDYKKAASICKKIIKLNPDNQAAHYNLAVCYYIYYHQRSKAYSELKKVIDIRPSSRIAAKAEFYIDYMRRNPDSRMIGDFDFIDEKE